jgi:hypothetical protein
VAGGEAAGLHLAEQRTLVNAPLARVRAARRKRAAGRKVIPAGTVMSKLENGKVVPRSANVEEDEVEVPARYIAETTMDEGNRTHAISGYGMLVGAVIYENLLPDADEETGLLPAGYHTELDVAGRTAFIYEQYSDSRGS